MSEWISVEAMVLGVMLGWIAYDWVQDWRRRK